MAGSGSVAVPASCNRRTGARRDAAGMPQRDARAMKERRSRGTRLLVALSGIVGVIALTAHFLVPPGAPPDTPTFAQLTAYGAGNRDAILVSAWLQATGALLI